MWGITRSKVIHMIGLGLLFVPSYIFGVCRGVLYCTWFSFELMIWQCLSLRAAITEGVSTCCLIVDSNACGLSLQPLGLISWEAPGDEGATKKRADQYQFSLSKPACVERLSVFWLVGWAVPGFFTHMAAAGRRLRRSWLAVFPLNCPCASTHT